jgi:hypothetical protein
MIAIIYSLYKTTNKKPRCRECTVVKTTYLDDPNNQQAHYAKVNPHQQLH